MLEVVDGESPAGPMPFAAALPIRQLIDGTEAAHEKNIVHTDLKTANIRVTPDGVVEILDLVSRRWRIPDPSSRIPGPGCQSVNRCFSSTQRATTPSFQPIFFPSS